MLQIRVARHMHIISRLIICQIYTRIYRLLPDNLRSCLLAYSLHVIRIQARPWGPSRERWWRISCHEQRQRAAPSLSIGSGPPPRPPTLNELERSRHPQAQFPYCTAMLPRWRRWVVTGHRACPTAADTLHRAQR